MSTAEVPNPTGGRRNEPCGQRDEIFSLEGRFLLKFGTSRPIVDPELGNIMKTEEKNRPTSNTLKLSSAAPREAEIRAETVARGKALIANPNYPSTEQMATVANILAAKWQAGTLEENLPECENLAEPDPSPGQNASFGCRGAALPTVAADVAD